MTPDVEVLEPPRGRTFRTVVGDLTVRQLTIGELGPFLAALRPVLEALSSEDGADILSLVERAPEAFMRAVAIGCGVDEQQVARLPLEQFVAVAEAVMEANLGFLAGRLPAAVAALRERVAQDSPGE